jgi:hypothetical protein
LSENRHDVKQEAAAHDQARHYHPIFPFHGDHSDGSYLKKINSFLLRIICFRKICKYFKCAMIQSKLP